MRSPTWKVLGLLLVVPFIAAAQAPAPVPGKTLKESWEAIYINDTKAGFNHLLCREVLVGERNLIQCTLSLELNVKRLNQDVRLTSNLADYETPDGKVVTLGYQQALNGLQNLLHQGRINGSEITITTTLGNQAATESKLPWDPQTLGMYGEARFFQNHKAQPGADFDYRYFLPEFKRVFRLRLLVKDYENVKLLNGEQKRLLRVEKQLAEKIEGVSLPAEIDWLDDQGEPVKRTMELPGFGPTTFYRTTAEVAQARNFAAVEISANQIVRMTRVIPRAEETREVTYRVRLRDADDPSKAFASDERQEIHNARGDQFEITVHGLLVPDSIRQVKTEAPKEYLQSNHFLRSDDALVRKYAQRAVGNKTDPWEKSKLISQWVFGNMKSRDLTQTFTPADDVAKTLDGDCRQHAVLAAAMCRAAGVPTRTALGLVHSPIDRGMIFHMWIEVWIAGKWYALDPTRGDHPVGAGHIKISDQSWNDETSLKPFLAVNRVLGKVQIDVVNVQYESP